jgi:hypothetical protein
MSAEDDETQFPRMPIYPESEDLDEWEPDGFVSVKALLATILLTSFLVSGLCFGTLTVLVFGPCGLYLMWCSALTLGLLLLGKDFWRSR